MEDRSGEFDRTGAVLTVQYRTGAVLTVQDRTGAVLTVGQEEF